MDGARTVSAGAERARRSPAPGPGWRGAGYKSLGSSRAEPYTYLDILCDHSGTMYLAQSNCSTVFIKLS